MEYNTHWNVAVRGEEHTYPTECLPIVLLSCGVYKICTFFHGEFCENEIGSHKRVSLFNKPVFWKYLGRTPDCIKTVEVTLCTKKSSCEYEDDGYCFDKPVDFECEYCQVRNEYYACNEIASWHSNKKGE